MNKTFSQLNGQKGFTIVETLVAVTILMIAIAGPLTVSTKAFTAALDARNQLIASNLAQEGLEELSNLKDSNSSSWPPAPASGGTCVSGSPAAVCGVSINPGGPAVSPIIDLCASLNQCKLTTSEQSLGYTYNTSAIDVKPTPFTRYLYFTQEGDQYLATVVVTWANGTLTNQVQLQEVFTDPAYQR